MNINKFHKGDIITRVKPSKRVKDTSYMSQRIEFVGVFKGTIVLITQYGETTLSEYEWAEGWEMFPDGLYEDARFKFASSQAVQQDPSTIPQTRNT